VRLRLRLLPLLRLLQQVRIHGCLQLLLLLGVQLLRLLLP